MIQHLLPNRFLIRVPHRRSFLPQFEVLGSFQWKLGLLLALFAFQSQHDLLRGLGFLVKNGFGLPTESHLRFGIMLALIYPSSFPTCFMS